MIGAPEPHARDWVVDCGSRYFGDAGPLVSQDLRRVPFSEPAFDLRRVQLPDWAEDLGIGGPAHLQVDAACVADGEGPAWQRCDWIAGAYLHLIGWLERRVEQARGPIHAYAARLPPATGPAFDHAWVNRIFLFLRRAAARARGRDETAIFGPRPAADIELTHDVDYLAKTVPLRLKNGAFAGLNALRAAAGGRFRTALGQAWQSARLILAPARYDRMEELAALEQDFGLRSTWHIYAGATRRRGAKAWLLDPGYRLDPTLVGRLRRLHTDGWGVGLHQSFGAWQSADTMARERDRLEAATGLEIRACRQHWLRFSWSETWRAQTAAGLRRDSSLGFNDRPGFRNGAALEWAPWDPADKTVIGMRAVPMVLMDSHLYAYRLLNPDQRLAEIDRWLGEVRAVGGQATVNFHPHGLVEEFGWRDANVETLKWLA